MPPKCINRQPVNDDPPMQEGLSDDSATLPQCRETRAAHSDRLRREVAERGRIPVTFNKVDGRPTGPKAASFITELGLTVRKCAPLQALEWSSLTDEQKKPLFDRLAAMFNVDFSKGPNSVKQETDTLMGRRYSDFRSKELHAHYKDLEVPEEDRWKFPHKACEDDDWKYLCALFASKEYKEKSNTKSKNRSLLPYNHVGGSKHFLQYSLEGTDGTRKDRITLFKETHYSTGKKIWVAETAQSKHEEMIEERKDILQSQKHIGADGQILDEVEIADMVCDTVLGKRSGYIRGLGNGPKPKKSTNGDASSSRSTNAVLRHELSTTRNYLNLVQSQLNLVMRVLESIAPGTAAKIQSLSHQQPTSSSAPSSPEHEL